MESMKLILNKQVSILTKIPQHPFIQKHPLFSIGIFTAILWILYHPQLLMREIFWGLDAGNYPYPYLHWVRNEVFSGNFPEWNPLLFTGYAPYYEVTNLLFYPIRFLLLPLSPEWSMTASFLIHAVLLVMGISLFLKGRGASWSLSFLGAWWMLTVGGLTVHLLAGHLFFLESLAWLGWRLVTWDQYKTSGKPKFIGLNGLLIALSVFAGHPQTVFYCLIFEG